MFDGLLGSKFSKKCKYCIKCIKSRVGLIKRKKQATVKFLKKDVADLLANGHESNAFGRMEALIVEINLTSCYDMIEKYCQCILDLLPSLKKQRECPEEATEAVATLIFATARFSDLPELFDLRRVFTERYGSHMESYVNAEFVEKLQKKSFSTDRKIRLMQEIADEFSVSWDSRAFRQRQATPNATSFNQSKSSTNSNGQRFHAEIDRKSTADGRSTVALNAAGSTKIRKEEMFNADAASNARDSSFNRRNEVVLNADISVNTRAREVIISGAAAVNGRDKAVIHGGAIHDRKEGVLGKVEDVHSADLTVNERKETGIDSDFVVNRRNEAVLNWETPRARFLQQQQVQPELKDIHVIPGSGDIKLKGSTNGSDVITNSVPVYDDSSIAGKVLEPTIPVKISRGDAKPMNLIPPPYTKPNFKNSSTHSNGGKLTDVPIRDAQCEISDGNERCRPVSVRRRFPKPPSVFESAISIDDAKTISDDTYGEATKERYQRKSAEEGIHGQKRNGGRRGTAKHSGVFDEEEAVVDRLLVHLSKKGTNNDSSNRRTRTGAHPEELGDSGKRGANGRGSHPNAIESAHSRPERVASLPTAPVIGVGVSKHPSRATSMHPDLMSPNGGRLHPSFPDYDDLTARFVALKNS